MHDLPRPSTPVKDRQTVTPDGAWTDTLIHGVIVRFQHPIEDDRGEIVEIFREGWSGLPDPVVFVYQISVLPGVIKGWVVHRKQEDRLFVSRGRLRFALYDDRPDSPSYQKLNVFTITERRRALVVIPRGVFHGIENVGMEEAVCLNLPTRAYDYADPDKYRLPVKNDLIPFAFDR